MTIEDTRLRETVVTSDRTNEGALVGHFDQSEFPIGGSNGVGHSSSGPSPYDLLGASLAACTAMTVRFQAERRKLSLERVEVHVTFQHCAEGQSNWFERTLALEGNLDAQQRAFLLRAANLCPVGKILGSGVDIRTRSDAIGFRDGASSPASYADDLAELQIPYVDPD